ncbi:MAG: hypothetical protein E6J34_00195 [Chloroflexi bacterium]|nr:MAG: hypothetical protein E6J34_00195 [Chloroflexota bacterium]
MVTNPEIFSTSVVLAAIGGMAVNLLNLMDVQTQSKDRRPDFKDWLYWLPFVVWPILGGVVAFIYQEANTPLTKVVAFHIGASAPLIIRSMASAIPKTINPGPGA